MKQRPCVCAECGRTGTHAGRGLCGACYRRFERSGQLDARYPKTMRSYPEHAVILEAKYGRGACWPWRSANSNGYGKHREIYEVVRGPIPPGSVLDHWDCERRDCVNPWHLDVTSQRGNLLRGETITADNMAKTHCPQGHPYNAANTYRRADGARTCRVCDRIRQVVRKKAKRDGVPYLDPFKAAA